MPVRLLAYCTALDVDRALLLYPRHLTDVDDQVGIRNAVVTIHETTIDLTVPLEHMADAGVRFAQRVFASPLAGPVGPGSPQ
jgi:hypothetical protein